VTFAEPSIAPAHYWRGLYGDELTKLFVKHVATMSAQGELPHWNHYGDGLKGGQH
jgi:hypothetical protein